MFINIIVEAVTTNATTSTLATTLANVESSYSNISIIIGLVASAIAFVAAHLPAKFAHGQNKARLDAIEKGLTLVHDYQIDHGSQILTGLKILADTNPSIAEQLRANGVNIEKGTAAIEAFKNQFAVLLAQIEATKNS